MKSDNEIKVIPGLQAIGNPFGIGESGYLWRNGKRFATVIWTRSLNGYDHVSVRPYGKRQLTDEEIERITRMFFESDPKYISNTVSKNAAVNFKQEGSLNELIADALLQIDKQVGKDPTLLKLVGGIFYDA